MILKFGQGFCILLLLHFMWCWGENVSTFGDLLSITYFDVFAFSVSVCIVFFWFFFNYLLTMLLCLFISVGSMWFWWLTVSDIYNFASFADLSDFSVFIFHWCWCFLFSPPWLLKTISMLLMTLKWFFYIVSNIKFYFYYIKNNSIKEKYFVP